MGLVLLALVHSAGVQDHDGALVVFWMVRQKFSRLALVWADGGYEGWLVGWVSRWCRFALQIVHRRQHGFEVLPRRWVVERTFAWLGRYRRLSKDYEYLPQSSETMIYLAMISLMLRRLRPPKGP